MDLKKTTCCWDFSTLLTAMSSTRWQQKQGSRSLGRGQQGFFFPPPPTNSQLWLIVHKRIVPPGSGVMLFFALSQNIPPVSTAGHAGLNERGKVNFLEKLQDLARRSEPRH